jgi:arylsulfatase A-like enzyme/Tfp pilus assembly protein PilF
MPRTPRFVGRLLACALGAFPCFALAARPVSSVVLISVDTLRADHLGCYGYGRIRTPQIDGLARGGTLFSKVGSPAPITLPSHTSLLSSTYPFAHGVEENGQHVPAGIATLATVLKANGYRTAAFIGGYVLDARFGLNRGFDVYDSPFHLRPDPGEEPPEVKRPGEAVLSAASQWLKRESGHPFFAFIHLYDVHQPYARGSYDAGIAYVDEALAHFRQSLAAQSLLENTLIVLTSDHGESLGEHGEETHGYFIYESTLRVPLIFHWPAGGARYPARVDEPASLIDVAPSILDFLAISPPPQFRGRSLLRLLRPHPPDTEPVYGESMYARDHLGCSPLRSIRAGRYKYIDAPKPELYDLATDSNEMQNRYEQNRSQALDLRARLQSLYHGERRPAETTVNPEVLSRLRSLGYLAGGPSRAVSGADPKDRLREYERYGRAIRLANTGHLPEAIREFQRVLEEDGQNILARFYLSVCHYRSGRLDEAVKALDDTLTSAPDYPPAQELLGTIWLLKKDYVRARQQFARLAAVAPDSYGAHYNLAILAMREGRKEEAGQELRAAARADPGSAQPHATLGALYCAQGDSNKAESEFRQALVIDPHDEASRKALEHVPVKCP